MTAAHPMSIHAAAAAESPVGATRRAYRVDRLAAAGICLETAGEVDAEVYRAAAGIYAATVQLRVQLGELEVTADRHRVVAAERVALAAAASPAGFGEGVVGDGR